jgi:hypothetical protein
MEKRISNPNFRFETKSELNTFTSMLQSKNREFEVTIIDDNCFLCEVYHTYDVDTIFNIFDKMNILNKEQVKLKTAEEHQERWRNVLKEHFEKTPDETRDLHIYCRNYVNSVDNFNNAFKNCCELKKFIAEHYL